jgi:hypothetical protein
MEASAAALDPFFNSQQQQQVLQEGMVYIRISIMQAFKRKDIMLHHLQAPVFGKQVGIPIENFRLLLQSLLLPLQLLLLLLPLP